MADTLELLLGTAGAAAFVAGAAAQARTQGLRRRWREAGLGLEERATGLASLAAVPILFPAELATARATDTQLAVVVMRRFEQHPERFGRALADATRAHETGWRIDYDLFATTLVVRDRNEALLAATRLGHAACDGHDRTELRVGIAMCPDDGEELLDAVDVALRRMRGFAVVDAVSGQLRRLSEGPAPVETHQAV